MRWLVGVVLVALVGCERFRVAPDAVAVDAAIDDSLVPFTTTGTTPAGSLDDIRYLGIRFLDGFCPAGYYVDLYQTNETADYPVVVVHIPIDSTQPPPETIVSRAWLGGDFSMSTDQVTFEVIHVDLRQSPPQPMRIAGRVTASAAAWNLDFTIDGVTERPVTCL